MARNVMMHVTLDEQHARAVRMQLIRDCGEKPWTMRVVPLAGTRRVRLSLYLPKTVVGETMRSVARISPAAELSHLLEVPDAPTDAWKSLMHAEAVSPATSVERAHDDTDSGHARTKTRPLARVLGEDDVLLGIHATDPDTLFARIGAFIESRFRLPASTVAQSLAAREALGSTGLGKGVAVPHGQIPGLPRAMALYVRPAKPIAFNSPDGEPVTDIVALLSPEWGSSAHLQRLADIAERFCDQRFRDALHACTEPRAIGRLFVEYDTAELAMSGEPPIRKT
jgi:PTS system nitrogen regulatory IIA component